MFDLKLNLAIDDSSAKRYNKIKPTVGLTKGWCDGQNRQRREFHRQTQ
jgi:hypothetical protein